MDILSNLLENGIIKEDDVLRLKEKAKANFNGDLEAALVDFGLTNENILKAKGDYFSFPTKTVIDTPTDDVLKFIPEDSAKHYGFIPISFADNVLSVGIVDPRNSAAVDALQFIATKNNISFNLFLITKADYQKVVNSYQGLNAMVGEALDEFGRNITPEEKEISKSIADISRENAEGSGGDKQAIKEDAPIIKIVAVIFRHAIEGNASDIHIENTGEKVKVRFRVDGILHTSLMLPQNVYSGVVARIKILARLRLDEKRKPQDGNFSAHIDNRKIDFRVSSLPAVNGEKIVIRILDAERGVKTLEEIGLSEEHKAMIKRAIAKPYGLILITGPTGSGKTTTIYSLLNELDREKYNVVSLEDPVEYNIPNVSQSQVMPEIGYTFATGLRSILRQDPDIIFVGEIRDKETAQLAIQAALTGHLVFSTLHTNNALGVVPRLVDMGVDPYLIAPTLSLAVAQRLVQQTCEGEMTEKIIDESTKNMILKDLSDLPEEFRKKVFFGDKILDTAPTTECPSGTKGRLAVFEMFEMDHDLEKVILQSPTEQNIYDVVRKKGMITMREDAIRKSIAGKIPFKEVYTL